MGSYISSVQNLVTPAKTIKRKLTSDCKENQDSQPKRKRLLTSEYIFKTLYVDGEASDIEVTVLGKKWQLHKVYLKQCEYFTSMFSGVWKESSYSSINITLPDPLIDVEALDVAFMSLYKDNIKVTKQHVVKILAAATLFQLESLREQCQIIMINNISVNTVLEYHTASFTYGLAEVRDVCFSWLLHNLMSKATPYLLSNISGDLMTSIISSPNLCVLKLETDVYSLLKKWLCVCLSQTEIDEAELTRFTDQYYEDCRSKDMTPLTTPEADPYIEAFRAVRWHNIISDSKSLRMLTKDSIVPLSWLSPVGFQFITHMLEADSPTDPGPEDLFEDVFNRFSFRCGRILPSNCKYCWRWVGYNYGVDLLFSLSSGLLTVRRNTALDCAGAVSNQAVRNLAIRMEIVSLDSNGRCVCRQTTGLQFIQLAKNKETVVCLLSSELKFPLLLSVYFLTYTPSLESQLKLPLPRRSTSSVSSQTENGTAESTKASRLCADTDSNDSS